MLLKLVLFCLCLWRLDGVFGQEKVLSVKEGDSVTLNSGLTEIKDVGQIRWVAGDKDTLIAQISVTADIFAVYDDVLDGRFRDRLKLDNQTGSLTITNTTKELNGYYHRILENRYKPFFLAVYDEISVKKGDSVTMNTSLTEVTHDDQAHWFYVNGSDSVLLIAKLADRFKIENDVNGRFRDRLTVDQTGSLTITDTTTEHAGNYVLIIFGPKESFKAFRVSVYNSEHCCGSTEAVIRLVLSVLVGVATVIFLVYDIRTSRDECLPVQQAVLME